LARLTSKGKNKGAKYRKEKRDMASNRMQELEDQEMAESKDKINRFCIQTLIDRNHHTNAHTSSDNLIYRYVHHACQFISSHKFCQFQYLAFCHFLIASKSL